MRRLSLVISVIAFSLPLVLPAVVLGEEAAKEEAEKVEEPAGKILFLANKCASCHTAFAAAIGEPPEEKADAEAEVEEETGPPDLSEVGASRKAEWLHLYLTKEEAIDGKKHMKRFKGSDEERAALVDWLTTLGAPADTTVAEPAAEEPAAEPAGESPVEEPAAEPAGESTETEEPTGE